MYKSAILLLATTLAGGAWADNHRVFTAGYEGVTTVYQDETVDCGKLIIVDDDFGENYVGANVTHNDKSEGDLCDIYVEVKREPSNGTLILNLDGTFEYTPNPGFSGEDGFRYTGFDKDGNRQSRNTRLVVPGDGTEPPPVPPGNVYSGPTAVPDAFDGNWRDYFVVENDFDSEGHLFTVVKTARSRDPEQGRVDLSPDGEITFTPKEEFIGWTGHVEFRYKLVNEHGQEGKLTTSTFYYEADWEDPGDPDNPDEPGEPTDPLPCDEDETQPHCIDPIEPPPIPECTPPNCPEVVRTYKPAFMPETIGNYSVPGVCNRSHPDPSPAEVTVVAAAGEPIQDALKRLLQKSPTGGVVEFSDDRIQCETIKVQPLNKDSPKIERLTLRGRGDLPRFYCRAADYATFDRETGAVKNVRSLGGTIRKEDISGTWLSARDDVLEITLENLHVDGYNYMLKGGAGNTVRLLNVYGHSGMGNGIGNANTGGPKSDEWNPERLEGPSSSLLEICGSELSHWGQGNHTHNTYTKRSRGGHCSDALLMELGPDAYDTCSTLRIVDSFLHSARWASTMKSIANRVQIYNSKAWTTAQCVGDAPEYSWHFDDDLPVDNAQQVLDFPSVTHSWVEGNDLRSCKPDRSSKGGSSFVGIRGRKTMVRGADVPILWSGFHTVDPETREKLQPPVKNPAHPAHTEAWWDALGGRVFWPHYFQHNTFLMGGVEAGRKKLPAIKLSSSYQVYDGKANRQCQFPMPVNAYERSHLFLYGNTFTGFAEGNIIEVLNYGHSEKNCGPLPVGPTKEDWNRYGRFTYLKEPITWTPSSRRAN